MMRSYIADLQPSTGLIANQAAVVASSNPATPGRGYPIGSVEPSNEPILLLDKPKRNGGTREVSEFGPLKRAAHTLLKTSWSGHQTAAPPSQHLLSGGRDKCVTATINHIENGGHKWACEMDIKNFYPSINIEWLKNELSMMVNPGSLERNIDASN